MTRLSTIPILSLLCLLLAVPAMAGHDRKAEPHRHAHDRDHDHALCGQRVDLVRAATDLQASYEDAAQRLLRLDPDRRMRRQFRRVASSIHAMDRQLAYERRVHRQVAVRGPWHGMRRDVAWRW